MKTSQTTKQPDKSISGRVAFLDGQGELPSELTKDGVHLNEMGYEKWVGFEREVVVGSVQ